MPQENEGDETEEQDESWDRVDRFINDFSIKAPEEQDGEELQATSEDKLQATSCKLQGDGSYEELQRDKGYEENKKLSGGALALFLLAAIPLTALGIIAILLLAAAFLVLSGLAVFAGWSVITAAFGEFTVFADVLVVLGCGFITLAIGLLFFWTFIRLLIGLSSKLVNGVINLAVRLCSREDGAK